MGEGEALLQAWGLECSLTAWDQMVRPMGEGQRMALEQTMVAGHDLYSVITTQTTYLNSNKQGLVKCKLTWRRSYALCTVKMEESIMYRVCSYCL